MNQFKYSNDNKRYHTFNYYLKNNNGSVIFKAYDQNNTICLNIYFDGFTSFKFDLEGI